jgi:hypothetical protein
MLDFPYARPQSRHCSLGQVERIPVRTPALRSVVDNIISGIGVYLPGFVTGLMSGVLTPLAASNASLALELRSTIDGILHQLDEILDKYKDPFKLALVQEQFFEELGSDLKQTLASVR